MKRLCIIPCGAKKIWDKHPEIGAVEAKNAYISPFGKACQAYATRFFTDWVFLSAKYGFLGPTDRIPQNYDLAFDHKSPDIITLESLQQQVEKQALHHFDDIIVLGGKKHRRVVEQLFEKEKLQYPLEGCQGIGYMLQRLQHAVQEGQEIGF
ncbi:DUF6884 domain-containing protein [Aneurinibacillus uraniidurans]|uniref:DUF6884 domain-containing protein n=1 Tax=Aneurinibacillus uraniidurans TaxID=2966586 RepID=UPI0023490E46|nr:DUF6884 domain-containing protein [Aneurinibacillus sp. B1]WCN39367.1 hypothetical protein PO771_08235 [Aneurinibacillus sp. B1]